MVAEKAFHLVSEAWILLASWSERALRTIFFVGVCRGTWKCSDCHCLARYLSQVTSLIVVLDAVYLRMAIPLYTV